MKLDKYTAVRDLKARLDQESTKAVARTKRETPRRVFGTRESLRLGKRYLMR